jgi:hypothetical protein
MELDAERHHNAPHHRRFDVVEGDLQADQRSRHLQAASICAAGDALFQFFQGKSSSSRCAG